MAPFGPFAQFGQLKIFMSVGSPVCIYVTKKDTQTWTNMAAMNKYVI